MISDSQREREFGSSPSPCRRFVGISAGLTTASKYLQDNSLRISLSSSLPPSLRWSFASSHVCALSLSFYFSLLFFKSSLTPCLPPRSLSASVLLFFRLWTWQVGPTPQEAAPLQAEWALMCLTPKLTGAPGRCCQRLKGLSWSRQDSLNAEPSRWRPKAFHWVLHRSGGMRWSLRADPNKSSVSVWTPWIVCWTPHHFCSWCLLEKSDMGSPSCAPQSTAEQSFIKCFLFFSGSFHTLSVGQCLHGRYVCRPTGLRGGTPRSDLSVHTVGPQAERAEALSKLLVLWIIQREMHLPAQ